MLVHDEMYIFTRRDERSSVFSDIYNKFRSKIKVIAQLTFRNTVYIFCVFEKLII